MYKDTKTIYKKSLIVGVRNTGKKVKIELEIHQESETRKAHTTNYEDISGYKSLSICGDRGQNIEEIADINNYEELFISKDDLQTIINIWKNWHLNDMKAGTKNQTQYIENLKKNGFKYDYSLACEELKKANLYIDDNYKYGNEWLVEPLPENVINEIIAIFEKYNDTKNIEQKTNKAIFKNFEVKATYKGDKKAIWSDDNFNNHMVKVTNTDTKQSITFEFWASIMNPELNTEEEILEAFYSFVNDALSGIETFENFCSELGYNTDSRKARSVWRACQRANNKIKKIYDDDIYNLASELQEIVE